MADYYNKNITYKGATDKGLTIQLIDSEDNKWSIWKKDYNDKEKDSEVYAQFKNLKMGEKFGISYGEKPSSFVNDSGKTINFTQRTIYNILPVIDDVAIRTPENTQKAESPRYEPIPASQGESKEDFGRRLAVHGMVNGLLANPNWTFEAITEAIPKIIFLEDNINKELAKPKGWAELGQKLKADSIPLPPEPPISADVQELADQMEINGDSLPF